MLPTEIRNLNQIRNQIQELRTAFNPGASPHAEKINRILKEFEDFADKYRNLWIELATRIPQVPSTTELVDNRIDELWRALQMIINQYREPQFRSKVEAGMAFLENLRALNSDMFPRKEPGPDVLIFIKDSRQSIARKYPYTNTFFIGISEFSANIGNDPNRETDWKPIAHELGHYIYWNSYFKTKGSPNFAELDEEPVFSADIEEAFQIEDRLNPSRELRNRALTAVMVSWSEEIFADLIGTMLLGRDYVTSAQRLFLDQPPAGQPGNRLTDDIEHPTPYLRSFVCSESLKLIEEKRNRTWSEFRSLIEQERGENTFDSEDLRVGILSMDGPRPTNFQEVSFKTTTLRDAIKVVLPLIYDLYQTSKARIDQKVGIPLIEARMRDSFLDSYVDISDVLEKGDGPGFMRKVIKIAKRVIRIK